ncbi:MAG: hypothetical protein V4543_03305 [Bacteroidota bacterium]
MKALSAAAVAAILFTQALTSCKSKDESPKQTCGILTETDSTIDNGSINSLPNGKHLWYFDILGRPIKSVYTITDSPASTTTDLFTYSADGNIIFHNTQNGSLKDSAWLNAGRIVKERTSLGTSTYTYDANGYLTGSVSNLVEGNNAVTGVFTWSGGNLIHSDYSYASGNDKNQYADITYGTLANKWVSEGPILRQMFLGVFPRRFYGKAQTNLPVILTGSTPQGASLKTDTYSYILNADGSVARITVGTRNANANENSTKYYLIKYGTTCE